MFWPQVGGPQPFHRPLEMSLEVCSTLSGATCTVQQALDAVVERLLLLHRVIEHQPKAGAGRGWRVFKNARFLNTSGQALFHFRHAGELHDHPTRDLRLRPGQQGRR